jgi:tetratricopeptide (TPR) repeat protein
LSTNRGCTFTVFLSLIVALLTSCSSPESQEDPRNSKFAALFNDDFHKSAATLDEEIRRNPNSLQALYWRATLEVEKGKVEEGIQRLDELLQRYPNYSFGYSERSRANYKAMRYDRALSDAELAIRFRPDVARNYVRRATVRLIIHQPDKALSDLKEACRLAPNEDFVFVHLLIADALMDLKQYHDAIPVLTEAIAHAGKDPKLYVRRALCYAHLKNYERAEADAAKATKVSPGDATAQVLTAALLSAQGHRAQALDVLIPVVKATPDERMIVETADLGPDVPSLADAALACIDTGHAKSAVSLLTLVEGRRPLDAEENFAFAKANIALNDRFRAAKLLNECLASQPTWVEPRVELIRLYMRDDLPQKARDVQYEGLKLKLSDKDRKRIATAMR